MEDPDTPFGTIIHWVIYNIPAVKTELPYSTPLLQGVPITSASNPTPYIITPGDSGGV